MRKTLLLFFGLFAASWVQSQSLSQEVIATAGDHSTSANVQLSWTIGEAVTETYAAGAAQLTQGFHQTKLTIVAVDEPSAGFHVQVYPNPVTSWVNIEAQASTPAFSLEVSDGQGRTLLIQPATPQNSLGSIDLSGYAPGLYLLRLRSTDGRFIQTFKIIKHN